MAKKIIFIGMLMMSLIGECALGISYSTEEPEQPLASVPGAGNVLVRTCGRTTDFCCAPSYNQQVGEYVHSPCHLHGAGWVKQTNCSRTPRPGCHYSESFS